MLARLRGWWRPTLAIPVCPREIVVVTDRGVELPLKDARGWSVLDVAGYLAEVDAL